AKAERKTMPVRLSALGNVTPVAGVAIKTQVDTTITEVHFRDGASVQKGDLLFTLDCRQIEADMKRVQAIIDGAQATLEQALRDVDRYTDLVGRNATPIVTLNNAQTTVNVSRATAESNRAQLENLKVQLGFCAIRAPISGRISMANVKVGNFVRQADTTPMATINQMVPVYVTFTVPQKILPDIRKAIAAETATVEAIIPGEDKRASGQVTMIENTVDPATGMATVRATMPNKDELLWPGTLVTTDMTLRSEEGVVVPSQAVQVSQTGTFVFVVKDGVAQVQPVKVERQIGTESVIASGLDGSETVVTEGQLLLSSGTRVNIGAPKVAGS
ncbi:MAG: efflux RND transporter periplasmic adaptor subunit, partial [Pseudolabrys sp.]